MRKVPFVFCLLRNPQPLLPKIWKLHPSNTEKHWQLLDSGNKRQLPNTMDYSNKFFAHHCHLSGGSLDYLWRLPSIGCVGDVPRITTTNHHGHTGANSMELWKQRDAALQKAWSRVIAAYSSIWYSSFHCSFAVIYSVVLVWLTRQLKRALCMISFKYRCRNFYISQYLRRFQGIVIIIGNMNVWVVNNNNNGSVLIKCDGWLIWLEQQVSEDNIQ